MKKIIILLVVLFAINKTIEAQCGVSYSIGVTSPITCSNPTVTIPLSTTVSPVSCSWTGPGIASGGNTLNPTVFAPGTYNFTLTNTVNGCSSSGSVTVIPNTVSPNASIMSSGSITCASPTVNVSVVLTSSSSVTYSWSGSGIISSTSNSNITVNLGGIYNCTITNISNGCSSTYSIGVMQNTVTPSIAVNSATICSGSSATLTASGAQSYSWSPATSLSSSSGSTVVSYATSSKIYTVTGTNATNGCAGSASTSVNVLTGPTLNVTSNSTICIGASKTLVASGATSYTWVPATFLNNTNSSMVIATPTITQTYSVTGFSGGCSATVSTKVSVINSPFLSIIASASSNSICIGSCVSLYAAGSGGTPIYTYSWTPNIGVFSMANDCPSTSTTYTVKVTDANGCYNSTTVNIAVNNTCQDVWPGDANSDAVADNLDVLELGLHYLQTGAARASVSNAWQSDFSTNWIGTISNGKNVNHSNCNGDGIINDDDTLAIYNNYNLTHVFKTEQTTTNPQLSIIPDQTSVAKGTWGTSSIYLGSATASITNLNGVAFTVNFDNTLIDLNSVWLEYPSSFINVSNYNLL